MQPSFNSQRAFEDMTTINTRSTSRRTKRVRDDEYNYREDSVGKRLKGTTARDSTKSVPRFLTKTFQMMNECDPTIASWSYDGDMIVIRDIERFESEVIPNFFETEKFSSFNRQLNFYGFRKVPSTTLRRSQSTDYEDTKTLRFQNDLFKRDYPELLHGISRATKSTHNDSSDQSEELQKLQEQLQVSEAKLSHLKAKYENDFQRLQNSFETKLEDILRKHGLV